MRFSLRTLLLGFVIVGLALTTLLTTWKLQEAEREIERVWAYYGVGGPNRFEMTAIGEMGLGVKSNNSFNLVRIDAPTEVRLQVHVYDGSSQKAKQDHLELGENDFEFALWYSRKPSGRVFNVRPLKGYTTRFTLPGKPPAEEKVFRYPVGVNSTMDDLPFLIYIFCPVELADEPNFQWIGQDVEKLKSWCEKYQCKTVYFKFEKLTK